MSRPLRFHQNLLPQKAREKTISSIGTMKPADFQTRVLHRYAPCRRYRKMMLDERAAIITSIPIELRQGSRDYFCQSQVVSMIMGIATASILCKYNCLGGFSLLKQSTMVTSYQVAREALEQSLGETCKAYSSLPALPVMQLLIPEIPPHNTQQAITFKRVERFLVPVVSGSLFLREEGDASCVIIFR